MERKILKTYNEVVEFFKDFNKEVFTFDTETTSLNYDELEVLGMSFCDGKKACYIDLLIYARLYDTVGMLNDIDKLEGFFKKLFKRVKILIGHNLVFDLKVLRKINILIPETTELYCSYVADHLLDENRPHGLKHLAKTFLNKEVVSWKEASKGTAKQFAEYAIDDAVFTWDLMEWQKPQLLKQNLIPLFTEIEMPFQRVLLDMEVNGILIDTDKVTETTKELVKEIENMTVEMLDMLNIKYDVQFDLLGGSVITSPINFNSTQHLAKILFKDLGLKPVEETPSGAPSVGKKTISILKGEHPFVALLSKYKIARKLLSAFFSPMLSFVDSDGRIRPHFNDCGTKTGRLSCSKPNLQQLPKMSSEFPISTRSCFTVPEGKTMLTADYSGQEVCVMAQVSRDPTLVDALNKGSDMHLKIANQFYELGIPEEALFKTHKDYKMYKEKFYNERNRAKTITFGLCYGKSAYGFSKDFNISEDEAQKIVDKYFEGMPLLKKAIDDTHKELRKSGFVTSMSTRRRRFTPKEGTNYYPGSAFRQSFNFLIQGFSADMIRKAMIATRQLGLDNPKWNLKIIGTVHDELITEINNRYIEEVTIGIKKAMESVVTFCVPVIADISVGKTYEEAK